jgi:capsular exopolysaccharide synthesis family protein
MKSTENPLALNSVNVKSDNLDLDFKQYWLSFKRRWIPATGTFCTVLALATVAAFLREPSYGTSGKLLIKADPTSTLTGLGQGATSKELTPLTMQGNPLKTESEVLTSNPLIEKTITRLRLKDEEGDPLTEKSLKKKLNVKNIGGTDILELSYESDSATEVAAVVNTLMNLYIENNIAVNQAQVLSARNFIYKELPKTEAVLRQAEANLRKFKETHQVVDIQQEAQSTVAAIEQIKSQLADLQTQLEGVASQSRELRQKLGLSAQQALALSKLSQTPAIQVVLTELQTLENLLANERGRFREENPQIVALRSKQASLQALLQERIRQEVGSIQALPSNSLQTGDLELTLFDRLITLEGERIGLSTRIAALKDIQAAYQQRINTLPRLDQEQRELQRKVEAAQSTYTALLAKLQELEAAENQTIGNARIIEPGDVPKKPLADKIAPVLVLGGFVSGLLLAGVMVFILEMRDKSIKSIKEAKELFEYTLLGTIPTFENPKKGKGHDTNSEAFVLNLPVRDTPHSPISEMYRMLQSNLEFLGSEPAPHVIVVCSSVSKEGKSTVAANLAAAVAEVKERVLLIDADMRRPFQHHAWHLTNEVGLSNVIVGQVKIQQAVREVLPSLDVLPCGAIPPNPVALLKSEGMTSIINYACDKYDYVIIDAPPLVHVSDGLILGKMADGILFVARPGVVDVTSATFAKESLARSGQHILGLVVNGVILKNESDSYFYHANTYSTDFTEESSGLGLSEQAASKAEQEVGRS